MISELKQLQSDNSIKAGPPKWRVNQNISYECKRDSRERNKAAKL